MGIVPPTTPPRPPLSKIGYCALQQQNAANTIPSHFFSFIQYGALVEGGDKKPFWPTW